MKSTALISLTLVVSPCCVAPFTVGPRSRGSVLRTENSKSICSWDMTETRMRATENGESEDDGLVLDNLANQMKKLSSKYPTSESAYLEASRKRAEMAKKGKLESQRSRATDEDWQQAVKKSPDAGDDAAWEESLKEAGNEDSQILMFGEGTQQDGGDDDAEDDEPKLLLF